LLTYFNRPPIALAPYSVPCGPRSTSIVRCRKKQASVRATSVALREAVAPTRTALRDIVATVALGSNRGDAAQRNLVETRSRRLKRQARNRIGNVAELPPRRFLPRTTVRTCTDCGTSSSRSCRFCAVTTISSYRDAPLGAGCVSEASCLCRRGQLCPRPFWAVASSGAGFRMARYSREMSGLFLLANTQAVCGSYMPCTRTLRFRRRNAGSVENLAATLHAELKLIAGRKI